MTATSQPSLIQRVANSAVNLFGRRIAILVLSAFATAALTRGLGPAGYGDLASAIAFWALLTSAGDVGFSLMLGRDLATEADKGALLRAAYRLQAIWAWMLTVVMVVVAISSGLDTTYGQCLLVLAVSVPFVGTTGARQVFVALYRTGELVRVDLLVQLLQLAAIASAMLAGAGPVIAAAITSAGTIVNLVAVALMARRHVTLGEATREVRRRVLRRVAELGGVAFMSKVYVSADLILLGWLVNSGAVGQYAVAAKVYGILTSMPAVVVNAALPAFATTSSDDAEGFETMTLRVWHWLLVTAMPAFLISGLVAPLAILVLGGGAYDDAVGVLQVLTVVGAVSVVNGLLGTILVARSMIRAMVVQNATAIVFNIGANLALVPRYGIEAAAWVTLGTELLIVTFAIVHLRGIVPFGRAVRLAGRPAAALAAAAAVGLALSAAPALEAVAATAAFVAVVTLLRAWPPEFRIPGVRRTSA